MEALVEPASLVTHWTVSHVALEPAPPYVYLGTSETV